MQILFSYRPQACLPPPQSVTPPPLPPVSLLYGNACVNIDLTAINKVDHYLNVNQLTGRGGNNVRATPKKKEKKRGEDNAVRERRHERTEKQPC